MGSPSPSPGESPVPDRVAIGIRPRWNKYIPHVPTPRQRAFLALPHQEAFFGGAAGGGKSDVLLMAALQYADVPGYSALLFRRTLTDLQLPEALIDRSRSWLAGSDARWANMAWHFPNGATLQFGYLTDSNSKYRYQSAAFQFIGFDELTHFAEEDYLYLRSRLRRANCPRHAGRIVDGKRDPLPDDPRCPACRKYGALSRVPLRIRAASNPGGIGHGWVRKRFDIRKTTRERNGRAIYQGQHPERPHMPSFLDDNPFLDRESYAETLGHLHVVERERLLGGDWDISPDGRFKLPWARYYKTNAHFVVLGAETVDSRDCARFMVVDPAASSHEGPADVNRATSQKRSHSAITTWLMTPRGDLLLWHAWRGREEAPDFIRVLKNLHLEHQPDFVGIEYTTMSAHVYQLLSGIGMNVKPFRPKGRDKVTRSIIAANRMERGRIWFPDEDSEWKEEFFSEIFTWTGHPEETDDQVDCLSYAALFAESEGRWRNDRVDPVHADQLVPEAWF